MSPQPLVRVTFDGDNAMNTGRVTSVAPTASGVSYVAGKVNRAARCSGAVGTGIRLVGARSNLWSKTSLKWTIAFWFREDAASANTALLDIRSLGGTGSGWQTYHGVNTASFTTCGPTCQSFTTPSVGVWHHLLYRYDATVAMPGAPIAIYLDGAFVQNVGSVSAVPVVSANTPDGILGDFLSGGFPSQFYFDDFQIYDEVYTPQANCQMILRGSWTAATNTCTLPP